MHTVDIVSDVSCPWCIIGYQSLQSALDESGADVKISWRPFELNPTMGPEGQDKNEHITQKYGITLEQAEANRASLVERGLSVGYKFSFPEDGRVYNTFNAHRLIHWAKQFDLQTELKLALFDLYFQQGGNPNENESLLACVGQVGLPKDEALEILDGDAFAELVRADEDLANQQGINSVPAFIFNGKYLVSGGQPKDVFMNVLQELEKEAANA